MSEHSILILETGNAISARLNGSNLRTLAADLYGDAGKAGLLADIRNGRAEHVSHAALHDLRRRMGLSYDVRYVVDVPADHDAAVHILPQGTGTLHTYTVPADAEVVIVPAGARVVQSKPPSSKPRRKRWRLDLTEYAGRITAEQVRSILDGWIERRYGANNDPIAQSIARVLAQMAEDAAPAPGDPARILHLVDGWLAEDAATDPGEAAAVLERLE